MELNQKKYNGTGAELCLSLILVTNVPKREKILTSNYDNKNSR